jgi:hypothetical protein
MESQRTNCIVGRRRGDLTACMTGLKHVQSTSHVTFAQRNQTIHRLGLDADLLLLDDLVNQNPDIGLLEWTEPESRTSRQERWGELMCIVGDDAEPRVCRVALHDTAKGHLGGGCHGVCLIENDQLEAGDPCVAGLRCHRKDLLRACVLRSAHGLR